MKKYIHNHRILYLLLVVCLTSIFIASCHKKDSELVVNGPAPTPKLPSQLFQYQSMNNSLATLGRVLFYDRNLSLNNAISCGSCHIQQYAFADNHQFSRGLNNGYTSRNASAILSSFNHNKFWDGRAGNFDTAVFMPVTNHLEMDVFNLNMLPEKLSYLSYYPDLFNSAFGTPEITVNGIRKALASFVGNLYSTNSKYDRGNLTAIEQEGENVFHGNGRCYNCHSGPNFNGYQTAYENIGLDYTYPDKGRGNISHNSTDDGKFAVPTLRNIALSAPYMHDGRYKTLREVIDHYSDGIQDSKNLSWVFRDFSDAGNMMVSTIDSSNFYILPVSLPNLTENEKTALEAFLKTLTDVSFVADPKFSNPF